MSDYLYFPILKTRDAELRAIKNMDSKHFSQMLPIYELTKSRRTKIAPDGDIHRRLNQIKEIQEKKPFILDLCTDENYINPQIEQLIDDKDGFKEWRYFLGLFEDLNIIPMIHIYENEHTGLEEVKKFVSEITITKKTLAIRLPFDLDNGDYTAYISPILDSLPEDASIIVILDGNYLREEAKANIQSVIDIFTESCREVSTLGPKIEDIVVTLTTFPSSPAQEGKEDAEGDFEIFEEDIYLGINSSLDIKYGDYASINTEQIEMKGGTFVPRIDIALEKSFIYKRYRRDDGSYPKCAKKMKADLRYNSLSTWADGEIELASIDKPTGISPSFWISVRMVYFMTSRIMNRSSK